MTRLRLQAAARQAGVNHRKEIHHGMTQNFTEAMIYIFSRTLEDTYTAFHKNIPVGISGCKKNRLNNGTFF